MPTYNVSVQNQNYSVVSEAQKKYAVGVTYDIPAKYLQNNNVVLDSINTGFNGVKTTFDLTENGDPYTPTNDAQLIVSINGQVQHPGIDFSVTGNQITFATAPDLGDPAFVIATSTTADLTRTVNYVIDSGSLPMQVGDKGKLSLDVTGVIESVTVLCDQTGDIVFDISKCTFADYPAFNSITAAQRVQLTNSNKYFDDVLNNWTTTIVAGDILNFSVISVSNIRRLLISLKLKL